jgi:Na+/proline symporter
LSAFAIILLPRQFHVTVVENRTPKQLKLAGFLFPTYLISINLFVLPVAIGGLLTFGGSGNADFYMLSLPLAGQMPVISLIIFIGGFSAASSIPSRCRSWCRTTSSCRSSSGANSPAAPASATISPRRC